MYQQMTLFLPVRTQNASVLKALSVGFPKQILIKKAWYVLSRFEATYITTSRNTTYVSTNDIIPAGANIIMLVH